MLIENLKYDENVVVFFVTGKKDYSRVKNLIKEKNYRNVNLIDFCYNMPAQYHSSRNAGKHIDSSRNDQFLHCEICD